MSQTTLLFIDDELEFVDVCKKFFIMKKYRVLTASSGREGLEIASREKPDLVVCDMRMPGLDGIQTLNQLRAGDQQIKVVFLTGYGTVEQIREGLDLGISDFIGKPFDLNALLQVIQEILHQNPKGESNG